MDIIGHVATAPGLPAAVLGPLACPSHSARPFNLLAAELGPEILT